MTETITPDNVVGWVLSICFSLGMVGFTGWVLLELTISAKGKIERLIR